MNIFKVVKRKMMNVLLFFVKQLDSMMYSRYYTSIHSPFTLLKLGFFQKVLGFNRSVPWPVHWSSTIIMHDKIKPGTRTPGISKYCYIDARNGIELGDNVWIGPYVKIISMNHNTNNYSEYVDAKPIKIAKNSWIGAGAIILPGIELGEHTVVGAGAVVTKSFLDGNQVIGGNPAKIIKKLPKYES